jgi:hypothetical protein
MSGENWRDGVKSDTRKMEKCAEAPTRKIPEIQAWWQYKLKTVA